MSPTTRPSQTKADVARHPQSKPKDPPSSTPARDRGAIQAAAGSPPKASATALLQLQHTFGNRAVGQAIQRAAAIGREGGDLTSDVAGAVESARGEGRPLDRAVGSEMGRALGADLTSVKVHTDTQSDAMHPDERTEGTSGKSHLTAKNSKLGGDISTGGALEHSRSEIDKLHCEK